MRLMGYGDCWEQGSEYHWDTPRFAPEPASPWIGAGVLFGSGRDALRGLICHGMRIRGWHRIWVPTYYCQEVLESMRSTGIIIAGYPDNPFVPAHLPNLAMIEPGDVLFQVNYFGLRSKPAHGQVDEKFTEIIEDHTHDPWSDWALNSSADWCVASLRKTLPIPDGGVVWSPRGHKLPPSVPPTAERSSAASAKLAAMVLKGLYLHGGPVSKDYFRQIAVAGEKEIASGDISGISDFTRGVLPTLPANRWRQVRQRNCRTLLWGLRGLKWVRMLTPPQGTRSVPFSGIIVFDTPERRDHVRSLLIAHRVYPSVLWPLEEADQLAVADGDLDFSRRMLSLHCDMRYGPRDMIRVAMLIRKYGRELD